MTTVKRALELLHLIGQAPMNVKEIAGALGIHNSSASRLAATLRRNNYLRKNSQGKYDLGYAIFELAFLLRERLDIIKVSLPFIEELNAATGETIHLAVFDGKSVVYINKIDSSHSIRMYSRVGKKVQPYCTAIGKVLLASMPKDDLLKYLEGVELIKYTDNTITDKESLLLELEEIKKCGLAWDRGEHEKDIVCVACPVYDFNNKAIASISISVPKRPGQEEIPLSYCEHLQEITKKVSREMGYVCTEDT